MRTYSLLLLLLLSACSISIGPPYERSQEKDSPAAGWTARDPAITVANGTESSTQQWCTSDVRTVKVLNPKPIAVRDAKAQAMKRLTKESQAFSFGDSCLAEAGGWWEWVGPDTDTDPPQVLVRYWSPPQRSKFFSCPSQAIFFVTAEEWNQRCKQPAETTDSTAAKPSSPPQQGEKDKVRQLLKDAGK